MSERSDEVVRAAGGVVRRGGEVAIVHRPRYDDWSLPKGKLDPGESPAEAALREVEEETGMRCSLGSHLGSTEYLDRKGRRKVVDYWEMEAGDGSFSPNDEVDELRWLPLEEAAVELTYPFDRELVERLQQR
jgi:8-oxo-dGTP pyrophosphatase MutT (NUDIX family)